MSTSYKPNLKKMTIMYDSPLQQGFEFCSSVGTPR